MHLRLMSCSAIPVHENKMQLSCILLLAIKLYLYQYTFDELFRL